MAATTPNEELMSGLLSCYLDGELSVEELSAVVVMLERDVDAIAEFGTEIEQGANPGIAAGVAPNGRSVW